MAKEKRPGKNRRVDQSARDLFDQLSAGDMPAAPLEQLISVFDAIDEKIYVADPESFDILYVNGAMKKLFGEDVLGKKCHKVMQDLDEPCDFCTNPLIFGKNLGRTHIWEFKNRKINKWRRCIDKAIQWNDGRMVRFEMAVDIHDRKVAEAALQQSEMRYRKLLGAMNEGFRVVDENGIAIYVNKRLCSILGHEAHEIIGRSVADFLDVESKKIWEREFERRAKGYFESYEIFHTKKDGSKVNTLVSPQPIFDEEGCFKGSFAVITDVTELKRAETALKARETELNIKAGHLEEMNAALRVLLKTREQDKIELEEKVLLNVNEHVIPYVEKLKKLSEDEKQKAYLDILEANLRSITSSFSRDLHFKYLQLTPTELHIAALIREGKSSGEIANLMNLSSRTVESHRKNIRKKMGLKEMKANLRATLMSFD
jgi:PAS domain S-box-containing protein